MSASLSQLNIAEKFEQGLSYGDFLAKYATEPQFANWRGIHQRIALSASQRELLGGFTRRMKVFCLAGAWCGDCVEQCPIFDHFAAATERIDLRFFDRDDHPDLGQALSVCGGARVPVLLFASEDDYVVGWYGDRTISKYRQMASELAGAYCPSGIVGPGDDLLAAVIQDWLDEFERIQLILRTSGRLRKLHRD